MNEISLESFIKCLQRAHDSAPGWDGIPYSAWKALGVVGARILFRLYRNLSRAAPPPPGFNVSVWCSLPKKPFPMIPLVL